MFDSTDQKFGQSSNRQFEFPPVFGQNSSPNNNPFGSTSPFGSQTGSSIFGGTSTGVFGTPSSSPVFGASSSPAFGSSMPAFGASSTPAFGASSSSFYGSSVFGQKPASSGFGSTTESSSVRSPFQQPPAPAFGATSSSSSFGSSGSNSVYGQSTSASRSSPFGATSSSYSFGSTSANGQSTSASGSGLFGATSSSYSFGSSPAFGQSTSAFGNSPSGATSSSFSFWPSPTFGQSTSASGSSLFDATSSSSSFGSSPAFGQSTSAFGNSPFDATSSLFSFGSTPAFGQSTYASGTGSSPFGATSTAFGAQSSPFGGQITTPAFASPWFCLLSSGCQKQGLTRVVPYSKTSEAGGGSYTHPAQKLVSISAMLAYKEKTHEELRWQDYQLGDKGGPNPAVRSSGVATSNSFWSMPLAAPSFGSTPENPFSSPTSNPFAPKTSTLFSPVSVAATKPFESTPSPAPSAFGPSSIFCTQAQGTTSLFGTYGQTSSTIGWTPPASLRAAPFFGQSTPALGQSNAFLGTGFSSNAPLQSTSSMGLFNQTTPSLTNPFQSTQPTQNTGGFGFPTPSGVKSCSGCQNKQLSTSQSPFANPFGTLLASSELPFRVIHKPAPMRVSCVLTPQHRSRRPFSVRERKYLPISVKIEPGEVTAGTTSAFGNPGFGQPSLEGQQHGGTRVTPYVQTLGVDGSGIRYAVNIDSISAMPVYKEKSHEELKWEDYQLGDEGGLVLLINLMVDWSLA